jgi:hypothetical protein
MHAVNCCTNYTHQKSIKSEQQMQKNQSNTEPEHQKQKQKLNNLQNDLPTATLKFKPLKIESAKFGKNLLP